jgi:hypothetical protein
VCQLKTGFLVCLLLLLVSWQLSGDTYFPDPAGMTDLELIAKAKKLLAEEKEALKLDKENWKKEKEALKLERDDLMNLKVSLMKLAKEQRKRKTVDYWEGFWSGAPLWFGSGLVGGFSGGFSLGITIRLPG